MTIMAVDKFGNWDGVCACGKRELDGVKCRYGATHMTTFSDGIGRPKRERERLPVKRKRERLDLFDDE